MKVNNDFPTHIVTVARPKGQAAKVAAPLLVAICAEHGRKNQCPLFALSARNRLNRLSTSIQMKDGHPPKRTQTLHRRRDRQKGDFPRWMDQMLGQNLSKNYSSTVTRYLQLKS
jgi:hypothetical protein